MLRYKEKDLYLLLEIDTLASKKEIKASYRSLARKYHPDVNKNDTSCAEKFKEITEAYEILVNDIKRYEYDKIRGINKTTSDFSQKAQAKAAYTKAEQQKSTSTPHKEKVFSDVFSDFMDGVINSYKYNKKAEQKPQEEPIHGKDITMDITISAKEAAKGTIRTVNVIHNECCKNCNGKRFLNEGKCKICGGQGFSSVHKKMNVKIPENVLEGNKVRIKAEGHQGLNGGKHGDLYLIVHIEKDDKFRYDGLNVLSDIAITPTEAALGTNIQVPTLNGFVTMKIPPETSSGQKFKLSNQGLSDPKSNKKGDQIVTVYIQMPKKLTSAEKELYQALAKLRNFNPRENNND